MPTTHAWSSNEMKKTGEVDHVELAPGQSSPTVIDEPRTATNHGADALRLRHLQPETGSVRSIEYEEHPNTWAKIRYRLREPLAEFLGTMILVMFGTGVDCQVVLSGNPAVAPSPKGEYLSISFGWGIGTALGVWTSAGISGGHINPAVTLAQVIFRRFPLRKFPIYAVSQIAGAFVGALITYANYWRAIDLFDKGNLSIHTASLFTTFPLDYMSAASCFWDEFLGTAILLVVVFAITDARNSPPPAGLIPLILFLTVTGLGAAFGMQTAYAINPARDLGPRMMTAIFWGRQVFDFRSQYWLWTPFLGPFSGALAGAAVYDLFIYTGEEARINSTRFPTLSPRRTSRERKEKSELPV